MEARTAQSSANREKSTWRTLPNLLTAFRLALIAPFAWLCVSGYDLFALGVFFAAAITDVIDGALARRFHQSSAFGRLADPIADKLLTTTAFVTLSFFRPSGKAIPRWIAVPVVSRDALILLGCVIIYLVIRALPFKPTISGKANTLIEVTTIVCFLVSSRLLFVNYLLPPLYVLLLASLVLSAVDYSLQGVRMLRQRS